MSMIDNFRKEAIQSGTVLIAVLVGGVLGSVTSKTIFGEKILATDILCYMASVVVLFPLVIACKIAARQWFSRKWSSHI